MASIEVVRLSKRYGARTAVDDLSFTAQQGDIIGLLGPNGAGKTTTIRLDHHPAPERRLFRRGRDSGHPTSTGSAADRSTFRREAVAR